LDVFSFCEKSPIAKLEVRFGCQFRFPKIP
jgi:hypothetical protein